MAKPKLLRDYEKLRNRAIEYACAVKTQEEADMVADLVEMLDEMAYALENPRPKKVVLAQADDWEALYVNGKLAMQNHSLLTREAIEAVGIKCESREVVTDWAYSVGYFPERLKDVEFATP